MSRPIAHHMICRLHDRRVIAPTVEQQRIVARTIREQAAELPLLCFNVPDTHLHFELAASEEICMDVARRVEITVVHRLAPRHSEAGRGGGPTGASSAGAQRRGLSERPADSPAAPRRLPPHGLAWDPERAG